MSKFIMSAEVNCGICIEVEADDWNAARRLAVIAMADHVAESCDGISAYTAKGDTASVGVRSNNDNGIEYYNLEGEEEPC